MGSHARRVMDKINMSVDSKVLKMPAARTEQLSSCFDEWTPSEANFRLLPRQVVCQMSMSLTSDLLRSEKSDLSRQKSTRERNLTQHDSGLAATATEQV